MVSDSIPLLLTFDALLAAEMESLFARGPRTHDGRDNCGVDNSAVGDELQPNRVFGCVGLSKAVLAGE